MKVRMKVQVSGHRDGEAWPAVGGEIVVPDGEGRDLCSQGYAEPVAEPARPERAVVKKAEKRA